MKKLKIFILLFCLIIPCFFVACSNQNKDLMSTPKGLVIETGGKITFERVSNEGYYVIEVDNIIMNVFPLTNSYVELYSIDGIDYLEYDASKSMDIGESYSVKVKACANGKKDSMYTDTISYTHTLPIDKPQNVQINDRTLTWDSVNNASYYRVRVVTPTDRVSADDSETIGNLDLSTYQFSTNRFDFSSILTRVGEYKFYVSAVSFDKNYTESGFTTKNVYIHTLTLDTPVNVEVHKVNELDTESGEYVDNLHMVAVIDSNANAITINTDTSSKKVELSTPNNAISLTDNIVDVNLSLLFNTKFEDLTRYNFTIQANYVTANENQKYYSDSVLSSQVEYSNYAQISKPIVEVVYDSLHDVNLASWRFENEAEVNNIAGYVLYLHRSNGITSESVLSNATYRTLSNDILAISVQALGKGNYLNSELSDTISQFEVNYEEEIEFTVAGGIISWTNVASQYLVEIDDVVVTLTEPNLDLRSLNITLGEKSLNVIVVEDGFIPYIATYKFNYSIRLGTPSNCGFSSSNTYLLTFANVKNAIGYYVYLNDEKIDRIFTSNAINLSPYVVKDGEYRDYSVQVQAVADIYSGYKDSVLSTALYISHTKVLGTPEFRKDDNGENDPIESKIEGDKIHYYLCFYGVEYASTYEIMINFNKITIEAKLGIGLYEIDVTDYMTTANSYTITVRALPDNVENIKPSEKNTCEYDLRLQLNQVTDIRWAENEGIYTLSFNTQDNAKEYRIHIIKVNDNNYNEYLHELGLKNIFTTPGAADITKYVKEAGLYQIYVTALADTSGGYYADSAESSEYAEINKLTTLTIPDNLEFNDKSQTEYLVRWRGDDHADYYVLRVTDPNGVEKEYQTTNGSTQININESYTIEGQYTVRIKSMIKSNSENALAYQSSSYCEPIYNTYSYSKDYDFKRYSVFMYGSKYDFYIDNVNDLMYILWYHVLYGIEPNGLKLYINLEADETVNEAIIRLANEAVELDLYAFDTDQEWETAKNNGLIAMFNYLASKLIALYPEFAVVNNIRITHEVNSQIFNLSFINTLNVIKESTDEVYTKFNLDYGNKYKYLPASARRKETTSFAIDTIDYVNVTNTEQLLMAVQFGKKPNFIGDCEVAETVYKNAKSVLLSITNNTMSDYEKVVAIFDWLEYSVNLNLYANMVTTSAGIVAGELKQYGVRKDYYLEGIFLDLNNPSAGGYDSEFYLGNIRGTNESYAKAFTLLCAIEGIETKKINGTYNYQYGSTYGEMDHTWNKVYLDVTEDDINNPAWFALDLFHSDNYFVPYNINNGYGMSSHAYFLVTDSYLQSYLGVAEESVHKSNSASTTFDYYTHATFSMSKAELDNTIYSEQALEKSGFTYSKKYNGTEEYQMYPCIEGYSAMQTFFVNNFIYGNNYVNNVNGSKLATFEIKVSKSYTNNTKLTYNDFNNLMIRINSSMYSDFSKHTNLANLITLEDGEGNVTYICTIQLIYG